MPLPTATVVYDVVDAKVYPLLTDISGAATTYGTAVDIPGINQVSMDLQIASANIKGDGRVIARRGKLESINLSIQTAKFALGVLDVVLGNSTLTAAGTTPNQTQTLRLTAPGATAPFKLAFQVIDLDPGLGSLNTILYRCNITGGSIFGAQTDQFGQPAMQIEAIPVEGKVGTDDYVLADFVLAETFTALP